jgi:8-oxo-dGTP pyrophosphatase MutT (NUDIX family)
MTGLNYEEHEEPPIRTVQEREVFSNQFIAVYDDEVVMPGNRSGRYLRIVQSGGRPGVAMLANCGYLFAVVQTYRYPLSDWEWGIPRGFAHGDDPLESARAELREELGEFPAEITPLGIVTPNSGLLADRVHVFYARYEELATQPVDVDEVAEVRWVDIRTLLDAIASGHIKDVFTLSAITLAAAHGMLRLPTVAARSGL